MIARPGMQFALAYPYQGLSCRAMADAESIPLTPVPERPAPLARNIVLVGFMGTGKTTLGKIAAKKAGFQFLDLDREIEKLAGKPIPRIFAEDGEDAFRAMETRVLTGLRDRDRHVISTGGGIVMRPENHSLLRDLGCVVWLHTKKRIIFERVSRNANRPLLQTADPLATICELVELRKPFYKAVADVKVKTTYLEMNEAVTGILESASWFFSLHWPEKSPEPHALKPDAAEDTAR